MIGHQQIIDWRKQGKKPTAIFLEAGFELPVPRFRFEHPEEALQYNLYPTVYISPEEIGRRQDFRFCIGCRVHVHAPDASDMVLDLAQAIADAKASHVVLCCDTNEIIEWKEGECHAYVDV